jgi:hypothetical protein
MTMNHDERDDDRDWPDDDVTHPHKTPATDDDQSLPQPEPEDAAHLPARHTRRPPPRKRKTYRPPSELDRD